MGDRDGDGETAWAAMRDEPSDYKIEQRDAISGGALVGFVNCLGRCSDRADQVFGNSADNRGGNRLLIDARFEIYSWYGMLLHCTLDFTNRSIR